MPGRAGKKSSSCVQSIEPGAPESIQCKSFSYPSRLKAAGFDRPPGGNDFPDQPAWLFISVMIEIIGMKSAMTMVPTMRARNTIMMGSIIEVMASTALSTSSS